MSADKYDSIQREAFGTLVKDGTYGVDFSHAPAAEQFFARVFKDGLNSLHNGRQISVLDCGCGPGAWLDVADKVAQSEPGINMEIYGLDITPEMIEVATARFSSRVTPDHFQQGDILNDSTYDFADHSGKFDIIFAYDVIQQLPPALQLQACQTMLGRLSQGGLVLVFDHDSQSRYGRKMAFKKFVTRYLHISLVPRYYCNAKYPPLQHIAGQLTSAGSFTAEMQSDPASNKCVLAVRAA